MGRGLGFVEADPLHTSFVYNIPSHHNLEKSMATVNVSFHDDLLNAIDNVAKEETRTRSELLREAARLYIERKRRWEAIFSYGKNRALENNITEADVLNEIRAYRREKIRG